MKYKKDPKMTQFNVRLTVEEKESLRRKAWDQNKSISNFVRERLGALLSDDKQPLKNNS